MLPLFEIFIRPAHFAQLSPYWLLDLVIDYSSANPVPCFPLTLEVQEIKGNNLEKRGGWIDGFGDKVWEHRRLFTIAIKGRLIGRFNWLEGVALYWNLGAGHAFSLRYIPRLLSRYPKCRCHAC